MVWIDSCVKPEVMVVQKRGFARGKRLLKARGERWPWGSGGDFMCEKP